jgi:hypothetical protein
MASFLDRLQNWDWSEFNQVLEAISKDRRRAYDFSQPPGAWLNEALKQTGLARSAFMGALREQLGDDYAGFPRPEERNVIYDMLWTLYGPKSTAQVGDETTAKTLLARSWLSQAMGVPISTTAAVPIARTPTAAGEVLQRALSLEGPASSLALQLMAYYQGSPRVVDDQAASFLVMAIDAAAAAVYGSTTRQLFRAFVYDAFNEYMRLQAEGKLDSSTNFIEYFLSSAAYWLNWAFPGLDTNSVLEVIARLEREAGAEPKPQAPDAGLPPEGPSQPVQAQAPGQSWEQFESPPTGNLEAIRRAQEANEAFRARQAQEPWRGGDLNLMVWIGSGVRLEPMRVSMDEVYADVDRYLTKSGPYPPLPAWQNADQFIQGYRSWRRQKGLPDLTPSDEAIIRGIYDLYGQG